jgi:hypothetical protein
MVPVDWYTRVAYRKYTYETINDKATEIIKRGRNRRYLKNSSFRLSLDNSVFAVDCICIVSSIEVMFGLFS